MKLWHDNKRTPPKGWAWANTNAAALAMLRTHDVTVGSFDYDMGPDKGSSLVRDMIRDKLIPPTVIIHSDNPLGAEIMRRLFSSVGVVPRMEPAHHA